MSAFKTDFAGLEVVPPGAPLSSDGYAFQAENPVITDLLLKIGAVLHRHDAHAAMANPTTAVVPTLSATGGVIAGGASVYVAYTLNDPQGGETVPVAAVQVVAPTNYSTPSGAPTAVVDNTAGTLLASSPMYAISVTDGIGGETPLGPPVQVTINPTPSGLAQVLLSGLTDITNTASTNQTTAGWRLWRSEDGGNTWFLLTTGPYSTDTYTDSGGTAGDGSVAAPAAATTDGACSLTVIVPSADQPPLATFFNVYACTDGLFTTPCLLGSYPISEFDAAQTFTALAVQAGQPPPVSSCLGGANQINPDTDILNWPWKQPVATIADLPSTGNDDGDARIVLADYSVYMWEAGPATWNAVVGGGGAGTWKTPVAELGDLPTTGNTDGDARALLGTADVFIWQAEWSQWYQVGAGAATGTLSNVTDGTHTWDGEVTLQFAGAGGITVEASGPEANTVLVTITGSGSGGGGGDLAVGGGTARAAALGTAYQPNADSPTLVIVTAYSGGGTLDVLMDASNPPTTQIAQYYNSGTGMTVPLTFIVPAGDYYELDQATGSVSVSVMEFTISGGGGGGAPVAARACMSGYANLAVSGTPEKVALDTLSIDTATNFDITTHRFNVPTTGIYQVAAQVEFDVGSTYGYEVAIYQNGTVVRANQSVPPNNQQALPIGDIIECAAGDYLELWVSGPSGFGYGVFGSQTEMSTFMAVSLLTGGDGAAPDGSPVAARAYLNATQTLPDATWTQVLIDTLTFDTATNMDVTSTHSFVCPAAGVYDVDGMLYSGATGAGVGIYKNGAIVSRASVNASGSNGPVISDKLQCAEGDTIELWAYSYGGESIGGGPLSAYLAVSQVH